jgi:hypothetical protein
LVAVVAEPTVNLVFLEDPAVVLEVTQDLELREDYLVVKLGTRVMDLMVELVQAAAELVVEVLLLKEAMRLVILVVMGLMVQTY